MNNKYVYVIKVNPIVRPQLIRRMIYENSYEFELNFLGYQEDINDLEPITIIKINKSLLAWHIYNRKIKNLSDLNEKDPYLIEELTNRLFNTMNGLKTEKKFINEVSITIDNKIISFYDIYFDNEEKALFFSDVMKNKIIENLVIQDGAINFIKNESLIKSHLKKLNLISLIKAIRINNYRKKNIILSIKHNNPDYYFNAALRASTLSPSDIKIKTVYETVDKFAKLENEELLGVETIFVKTKDADYEEEKVVDIEVVNNIRNGFDLIVKTTKRIIDFRYLKSKSNGVYTFENLTVSKAIDN